MLKLHILFMHSGRNYQWTRSVKNITWSNFETLLGGVERIIREVDQWKWFSNVFHIGILGNEWARVWNKRSYKKMLHHRQRSDSANDGKTEQNDNLLPQLFWSTLRKICSCAIFNFYRVLRPTKVRQVQHSRPELPKM